MYVSTSQSIVFEWHQFQGLNVVIYSQYRQNFRACPLDYPFQKTRPPVGARLVVPTHWAREGGGDGRRAGASGVRARDGTDSERDTTEIHRGAGGGTV